MPGAAIKGQSHFSLVFFLLMFKGICILCLSYDYYILLYSFAWSVMNVEIVIQ